ncbi:QsdR family transcriptional regulator [Isoptericola halotolerans]|uniref:AcrR family transcriptional regulator n=1 Tax=Isoptericola halotolerans TaxID=300560 RepID=A0ABX2A991_9MICO|nr:QsdR family transcriptional regulator [Isoptericola halotolerans]NOV98296.1 AcrR family transcriptional regulator [Isoptericola halotolerans]
MLSPSSDIATVGLRAAPTRLSARLVPGVHADALRAFEQARETFVSGHRIDMGGLATELGVDRTSVFRWVGNRDALLSEVLWSLAVPTLVQAERAASEPGPDGATPVGAAYLAALLSHFATDLIEADYFRTFLSREPARALRLLTTSASPIQQRYVATVEPLVREHLGTRPFDGAIDRHALAYLLVRVSESFTYADLIAGEPPSTDAARSAFRHLLRV